MTDFFDEAYHGSPPWDIGRPQPAMLALLDELPPAGPVLDIGCGTGDLGLALAGRGLAVVGLDLAEAAIAKARAKAEAAGLHDLADFEVGDALHPAQLGRAFGAVVDTGFFHLFEAAQRAALADELATTLAPGGRYYLLGFAIDSPNTNAPHAVGEDELRALFAPARGWQARALRAAVFETRSPLGKVPALAGCMERT
jgi:SAM-dependent methyltransferase